MSIAQIEAELDTLSLEDLRAVEEAARRRQWRHHAHVLDGVETRLFHIINEPLPGGEHLRKLRAKRDERTLATDGYEALIQLDNLREEVWARKLRAVSDLAGYRGVDFDILYRQLELHLRAEETSMILTPPPHDQSAARVGDARKR